MAKYLATFSDIHNEEFEITGFKIFTDKEYQNFEDLALSITWEFSFYADKESLTYSSGEDLLSRIDFKEISTTEFNLLEKIFDGQFGVFVDDSFLRSIINSDSDESDILD